MDSKFCPAPTSKIVLLSELVMYIVTVTHLSFTTRNCFVATNIHWKPLKNVRLWIHSIDTVLVPPWQLNPSSDCWCSFFHVVHFQHFNSLSQASVHKERKLDRTEWMLSWLTNLRYFAKTTSAWRMTTLATLCLSSSSETMCDVVLIVIQSIDKNEEDFVSCHYTQKHSEGASSNPRRLITLKFHAANKLK